MVAGLPGVLGSGGILPQFSCGDPSCWVLIPPRFVVQLELAVVLFPGEREVGTEGKILLLAREDKKLQGVGLQSRQPVRIWGCQSTGMGN